MFAPELVYPASTDLHLADKIVSLLESNDIKVLKESHPFDHGVFVPLKLAFPHANIPIVEVSMKTGYNFEEHLKLGKILSKLRYENILIIGSGLMTLNPELFGKSFDKPNDITVDYANWVIESMDTLTKDNKEKIENDWLNLETNVTDLSKHYNDYGHLIPFFVALGAALGSTGEISCQRIFSQIILGNLCLDSYIFK